MLRSNIDRSVIYFLSRDEKLRDRMLRELNISIRVRPLQHIIKRRQMLLDEIGFQIETFTLILHTEKINRLRLCNHILFPNTPWSEVLPNPLLQILRFPDIENLPLLVFEKVNTRYIWKVSNRRRLQHQKQKRNEI